MARPVLQLDESKIEKLAAMHCSLEEIAAFMNCSVDTLGRRYAEVIERGRLNGKCSLKRKQMELALAGNVTLLIWLGKIHLGQSDRPEVYQTTPMPSAESVKTLQETLDGLKRIGEQKAQHEQQQSQ